MPDEHNLPLDPADEAVPPIDERTAPEPLEDGVSFGRWLVELVVLVGLAFALAQGVKSYVIQPFIIPSGSMIPTLEVGDRVLVNKFLYRLREPRRGDIVVFQSPASDRTDYIKRIVAIEGQTVDVRDNRLVIDGEVVDEPWVHGVPTEPGTLDLPLTVPPGQIFLMGDNRTNSTDSRWFGPRPIDQVLGRAFMIYWPPRDVRGL